MPILTIFIEEDDPNFQAKPPATSGIDINSWGNEYKHYISLYNRMHSIQCIGLGEMLQEPPRFHGEKTIHRIARNFCGIHPPSLVRPRARGGEGLGSSAEVGWEADGKTILLAFHVSFNEFQTETVDVDNSRGFYSPK